MLLFSTSAVLACPLRRYSAMVLQCDSALAPWCGAGLCSVLQYHYAEVGSALLQRVWTKLDFSEVLILEAVLL